MTQNLGSVYKRGRKWWVTYNVDGNQHRESSRSTRKGDATRLLGQRIAEISDGRFRWASQRPHGMGGVRGDGDGPLRHETVS